MIVKRNSFIAWLAVKLGFWVMSTRVGNDYMTYVRITRNQMDDEFRCYEQCWDDQGWMYLKAWYFNRKTGEWSFSIVDD